jgi:hypothetical protein
MRPRAKPLLGAGLGLALTIAAAPGARAESFSHADWTAVLERFVDERGLVDYRRLARDREVFDRYLGAIERASPSSRPQLFPTRDDALAYYLNAYNALVFKGVLARGPEEDTVWTPFGTGYSFFSAMPVVVGGKRTSLKALEDEVVRSEFQDPRVHAALNCASLGCPRLPRKAFEGPTLAAELDAEMMRFVGERRNCAVDAAAKRVGLSKIFDWFAEDFLAFERRQGNASPSILDYVNRYRATDARIPRDYAVEYLEYDKRINKQ